MHYRNAKYEYVSSCNFQTKNTSIMAYLPTPQVTFLREECADPCEGIILSNVAMRRVNILHLEDRIRIGQLMKLTSIIMRNKIQKLQYNTLMMSQFVDLREFERGRKIRPPHVQFSAEENKVIAMYHHPISSDKSFIQMN